MRRKFSIFISFFLLILFFAEYAGATGDQIGRNVNRYGGLAEALSIVGSTPTTLLITDTQALTSGVTVPKTASLIFGPNGKITGSDVELKLDDCVVDAGEWQIFGSGVTVTGNMIVDAIISEWWGAKGDGSTDDHDAIDVALTHWLQRTVPGNFQFVPGKNYLCNTAISKTVTSNIEGAAVIDGYGSKLTSGLSTGVLLTITANAYIRYFTVQGLTVVGSQNEDGLIKLDGDDLGSNHAIYELSLTDLNLKGFAGTGIYFINDIFECSLMNVRADAHSSNVSGYGLHFDNGAHGPISSIDLVNCQTRYGKNGVYVESPVGDVNIYGGTFLTAQEYGVYLANSGGSIVIGAHFENNWESAGSLAAGNAGLFCSGTANVIGCRGTTIRYQRYVVRMWIPGTHTSQIIGGHMGGDTVAYAYIHGAAGSHCNIIGNLSYYQAGPSCIVSKIGSTEKQDVTVETSGTGVDDLMSYVVPADNMGMHGGLKITASGTKQGANNTKAIWFHWGTESGVTIVDPNNDTEDWRFEAEIMNYNNILNSQKISWVCWSGTTMMQGYETATQDTTSGVTVLFKGECANLNDKIKQQTMVIKPF